MTAASNWRDVKAQARAADPTWDSAERVARRQRMREQLLASIGSAQFHDWDDIRAELDDGDSDALHAERVRTEAWVSDFDLAEERVGWGPAHRASNGPHLP
ncbi:hypothetical protein ACQEVZ_30160 [Dactylosporangium sp. CA-152071]|uniref:hypothetical protein n=1 Tax=Dactylosporangium sp. CA-152071 TaxID=3239933 RepID=UPI003D8F16DC